MAHLKYAVSVAREKPMVFGPSLVEVLIAFVNQRILESWAVYNEFIDAILDYFYSQTGVSPVSYVSTGFEFDYTRFIGWVLAAVTLLSLLSWLASLASIRASWRAVRGEEPTAEKSFADIPAVCIMDAGNNGVVILADRMMPPRKRSAMIPGPQSHLAKLAFERYYLWKSRNGYVNLP